MKKKSRCLEILKDIGLIILGGIIFNVVIAIAETLLSSNQVIYDNSISGAYSDTVQGALDELYARQGMYDNIRIVDNTIYFNTQYINSHPIYFNPTTGEKCNDYVETNSQTGKKEGCMKWYAYSQNQDGTINMILDHNLTSESSWISKDDYEKIDASSLGVTYDSGAPSQYGGTGNNEEQRKGPLSTLKILKEYTSSWSDVLKVNTNYNVNITNTGGQRVQYTINYSDYKARLISAEEVAIIIGADKPLNENGLEFNIGNTAQGNIYLDGGRTSDPKWRTKLSDSYYTWLFDNANGCSKYGCNDDPNVNGYWSSSPYARATTAWGVGGSAELCSGGAGEKVGIRPVIAISKSKLH